MNRAAVIGAGTMGNGIAHVFAQHGWSVALIDTVPAALDKATATIRSNLDRQVKKGKLDVEDRFSGERRTIAVVAVVDAGHRLPDPTFASADGSWPAGSLRAGDVVAPRTIHEAILEGRRAAHAIDGVGRTSDGVPMGATHH